MKVQSSTIENKYLRVKSINIGETKYYQNRFKYKKLNDAYINESVLLIQHDDLDVFEITSEK